MLFINEPFTMMIAGPSGCGKTSFVIKLLNHLIKYKHIVWCNAERKAIPDSIINSNNITIHDNLPESFDNLESNCLIILDDLMTEAYNKNVCELFTKGSHHRNLSVILTTQNIFHQGRFCRDISLNCKYLVIFKNPRDKSQIYPLARQIFPDKPKELLKVYKEVTSLPYGYLFIDLTQECDDLLRFQTDVFKNKCLTCYTPQNLLNNRHEKIEGAQTYITYIKKL